MGCTSSSSGRSACRAIEHPGVPAALPHYPHSQPPGLYIRKSPQRPLAVLEHPGVPHHHTTLISNRIYPLAVIRALCRGCKQSSSCSAWAPWHACYVSTIFGLVITLVIELLVPANLGALSVCSAWATWSASYVTTLSRLLSR